MEPTGVLMATSFWLPPLSLTCTLRLWERNLKPVQTTMPLTKTISAKTNRAIAIMLLPDRGGWGATGGGGACGGTGGRGGWGLVLMGLSSIWSYQRLRKRTLASSCSRIPPGPCVAGAAHLRATEPNKPTRLKRATLEQKL